MPAEVVVHAPPELDAIATSNLKINLARGLNKSPLHTKSGPISVCGNGPSLNRIFPFGTCAALNGAWRSLRRRGIVPKYIIAYDPTPENLSWFEDSPQESVYLLGSRIDPRCIDLLQRRNCAIYLWHLLSDQERALGLEPMIGGGHTVGSASLNLLASMGYTHFNLYGYDSCWSYDGQHHASPQEWAVEPPKLFQIGEKQFLSSPWMLGQVEQMLSQVFNNRLDYTVKVHDGGMLDAALKENTLEIYYDLDQAPGSFDFIHSLGNAVLHAHDHDYSTIKLQFRNNGMAQKPQDPVDLTHAHKSQMINNVVRPLVEMFGIQEVDEVRPDALNFHYMPSPILNNYRATGYLPDYQEKAEARKWAYNKCRDHPITITLREASYWPQRNSNLPEWEKFARYIEKDHRVIIIRDTGRATEFCDEFETCPDASLDLHKRLALYRRAKMNFFVMNGPAALCFMTSTIPYTAFFKNAPGYHCYDPVWLQRHMGIDPYGQMPWANLKTQKFVYKDDTFAEIVKVYEEMLGCSPREHQTALSA